MSLGMAMNLQRHLSQQFGTPALRYHNRTISRGEPLQEIGGVPAPNISGLVATSDIIFLSLCDDAALEATVAAILAASGEKGSEHATSEPTRLEGKTIVDTSTMHPNPSDKARSRLAEQGATFVAAPCVRCESCRQGEETAFCHGWAGRGGAGDRAVLGRGYGEGSDSVGRGCEEGQYAEDCRVSANHLLSYVLFCQSCVRHFQN